MRDLGRLVKGYTCAVFGLRVGPPGSIFRPWKVAFLFFRQRKIFWEHFGRTQWDLFFGTLTFHFIGRFFGEKTI